MNHNVEIRYVLKLGVGEYQLLFDEIENRFLMNYFNYEKDCYYTQQYEIWGFDYDKYLFKFLESGWKLEYMSVDEHFRVWLELDKNQFKHNDGITIYKKYCKEQGITCEVLFNHNHIKINDVLGG